MKPLPLFDKWKKQILVTAIAFVIAGGTALPPEAYKPMIIAVWCVFDKSVCELKNP